MADVKRTEDEDGRCGTCKWFVSARYNDGGWCHRYPPTVVWNRDGPQSHNPDVELKDHCGEWKKREGEMAVEEDFMGVAPAEDTAPTGEEDGAV